MFLVSACVVFVIFLLVAIFSSSSKEQKQSLTRLSIKFEPQKIADATALRGQISSPEAVSMIAIFLQPDKTTLLLPELKDVGGHVRHETASIGLQPELLQAAKDGQGRLLLAAVKPDAQILSKEDLVAGDPTAAPLVADGKKLLGKLQDLQKDGQAIYQEIVLPDEKVAFMPPPPPPPPPPKPTPIERKPRSTSTSSKTAASRPASNRKAVTQLQRIEATDDTDYSGSQAAGGNQAMQGQKLQGQRIQGQRMR